MDFNETEPLVASARTRQPNPFAVCRLGILWRVIAGVQVPMALGALFGSTALASALMRWAQASVVSVPATLLWLLAICLAEARLGRLPAWAQTTVASIGGGLAAWLAMLPSRWVADALGDTLAGGAGAWDQVPPVLTGMVLAAVTVRWLRARASAVAPTDAQARLAELQARIRPHFLFNTLNTAIALVQIDPRRAESVLEDLAELFREAMASPHAQSTLRQELDLARRYLAIEALRFGDRLRVDWQVDDGLGDTVLPALVLQPLVENAVRHGVEPAAQGGWVRIEACRQGGQAVLQVTNSLQESQTDGPSDGGGVNAGASGQGMALRNVRQRLRLMYDVEADFRAVLQEPQTDADAARTFVARMAVPLGGQAWA